MNYEIEGPYSDWHKLVSSTFNCIPVGTYTLVYNHGGPPGATLTSITPQPTQTTSAGKRTTFTLNFVSESEGTIEVNALLDGKSWETAIGSGSIRYGITGPVSDSSTSMPDTFSGLPSGSYTLNGPYVDSHGSVPYTFDYCPGGKLYLEL